MPSWRDLGRHHRDAGDRFTTTCSTSRRFFDERQIRSFDDLLRWGYDPTGKQRNAIMNGRGAPGDPVTFRDAFANKFVADKFGEATTHWRKLNDRILRGVGNPCPLVTGPA